MRTVGQRDADARKIQFRLRPYASPLPSIGVIRMILSEDDRVLAERQAAEQQS